MPSPRSSRADALVSARTPNEPAPQSPRPGIARRADPPVTWMSVAGPACASRNRPAPERNPKAERARATAQSRRPPGRRAEGRRRSGRCGHHRRLRPHNDQADGAVRLRCLTQRRLDARCVCHVGSTGSAPNSRTAWRVASDRPAAATCQPSRSNASTTARPRLRAPNTRALFGCPVPAESLMPAFCLSQCPTRADAASFSASATPTSLVSSGTAHRSGRWQRRTPCSGGVAARRRSPGCLS